MMQVLREGWEEMPDFLQTFNAGCWLLLLSGIVYQSALAGVIPEDIGIAGVILLGYGSVMIGEGIIKGIRGDGCL